MLKKAFLPAALAAAALLGACAVPVRTVRVESAPIAERAAYVEYGTVRRIETVDTTVQPGGGGALLGGAIGGALGNQIGHGGGRAAATILGVFGGAVAGNRIEQNQAAAASNSYYHVVVEFDNGTRRAFDYRALDGLRVGERVRFAGRVLERA